MAPAAGAMGAAPPDREITDAQIAAVAAYIADTAKRWVAASKPGGN